ncbi:MAG: hypothetical protein IJ589_05040 [Lachnospiraceae bacterium]|nr:hypothetical protein [Lachnospiraceae bacterium]
MSKVELFVPGRLCLMGEHSDWAGMYKSTNSAIVPGEAIVTGVEQGIYAIVEKAEDFSIDSELEIYHGSSFSCIMDPEKLRETASAGGFFSYVAGVASYVCENYKVGGVHITITKMTLPIKSGLSSSAAICVLVARAFNILYKLRLNTMGEMQIAFIGEQRTPSRCGRLDQACAYGVNPVRMIFEGTEISVKPLKISAPMHFVVADLKASKDTIKILADLNKCFPFAQTDLERTVQEALGNDNKSFIEAARKCIEDGDVEAYGHLMTQYQENFDKKIAPACPQELKAPVLHSVLNNEIIHQYIHGAKGVGSQGDGTVQFLAKDEQCQQDLIEYLKNELEMPAFALTLRPKKAVSKAIIPVAGFGTRMFPATKAIKKDFLPILDVDGLYKPVLLIMFEELVDAGIEKICLVIGEDEKQIYDDFFAPVSSTVYEKLPEDKKAEEDRIRDIKSRITYVTQSERKGFGHAVYLCKEFTADEPVLLLLGDYIYHSREERNCARQMIDAYERIGKTMVSIHSIDADKVVHYGVMHGYCEDKDQTTLKIDKMVEKPTMEFAQDYLGVKTRGEDKYYAVFGQYILTKEVFDDLGYNIRNNVFENGEIQLTTALDSVREKHGLYGYAVNGVSYDVGIPGEYYETSIRYGQKEI